MATRRAEIGLADWVRVMEQLLETSLAERYQIARCLGLQASAEDNLVEPQAKHDAWKRKQHQSITPQTKPLPTPLSKPEESEPPIDLPYEILPISIEKLPNTVEAGLAPPLPPEIENQIPLQLGESGIPPIPRIPLFPQCTVRGLLSAAVSQPVEGYDLDIPRLIQASIQRRPLRKLPLLPRLATRNGCQLLLDFSDALVPWWDDMRDLMQQFRAVLGETACPVYEFTDDPFEAIRWTETREIAWKTEIIEGQPVVIATDFGQVRAAHHDLRPSLYIWRKFVLHCRRLHIPVIAFTPLSRERYLNSLEHHISIIEWQPNTRAEDIKRLVKHKRGIWQ